MGLLRGLLGVLAVGALFTGGYALASGAAVSLTAEGPRPDTVTIDWGGTVVFSNVDTVERTVTSERAQMASGAIPPGGTFEFRFTGQARQYRYSQLGTRPVTFGSVVVSAKGKVTLTTGRQIVPYGSPISLAGRSSYPGTPVEVQFRPAGGAGQWETILNVTAAADGTYSGRARLITGGRLRALVAAGLVSSDLVDLAILPRLQMRAGRTRVKQGSRIVVLARVTPASAAESMDLEERELGQPHWRRKATKAVSKKGTVTFVVKATEGRNQLRLVLSRSALQPGFAPAVSQPLLVIGT